VYGGVNSGLEYGCPPMSLSTQMNVTRYAHFRGRFRNATGHRLITPKVIKP
jgi:hypothetical protein